MRFVTVFAWLLAFAMHPALGATSPPLRSLEYQLALATSAKSGDHGIAALDLGSGEFVGVRADDPFPMASTVKIAIAAFYLAHVEQGSRSLDDRIGGKSAASLMEAMIVRSDNRATDLLLANVGGPGAVQSWLDQLQVKGLRVDRTIAQLLADRRNLFDVRDSSTPRAMVTLLRRLDSGELLQPSGKRYLLGLMARCATGKNRIRGLLPATASVEHKTGTLSGLTSDVGFITLPNGRRLAVAFFARNGTDRSGTIAQAARAIYDGFAGWVGGVFESPTTAH
jgi:beta-lactamase class A